MALGSSNYEGPNINLQLQLYQRLNTEIKNLKKSFLDYICQLHTLRVSNSPKLIRKHSYAVKIDCLKKLANAARKSSLGLSIFWKMSRPPSLTTKVDTISLIT